MIQSLNEIQQKVIKILLRYTEPSENRNLMIQHEVSSYLDSHVARGDIYNFMVEMKGNQLDVKLMPKRGAEIITNRITITKNGIENNSSSLQEAQI